MAKIDLLFEELFNEIAMYEKEVYQESSIQPATISSSEASSTTLCVNETHNKSQSFTTSESVSTHLTSLHTADTSIPPARLSQLNAIHNNLLLLQQNVRINDIALEQILSILGLN
jgi:hypothetical protein